MTSGLGISERYNKVMRPPAAKDDESVLMAVEAWEREKRELKELDPSADISQTPGFEMTALKCILPSGSRIREHIEEKEDEIKTYIKLRTEVINYATRKRKEYNRTHTPDGDGNGHRTGSIPIRPIPTGPIRV